MVKPDISDGTFYQPKMMDKNLKPAGPDRIDEKETAAGVVFAEIRRGAPVPRIDIAQATGLSPATVTSVTADLITKGLIKETPAMSVQSGAKRGRPRVNLVVRSEAHVVAGIGFGDNSIVVALMDFQGNRIDEFTMASMVPVLAASDAVQLLKQALDGALMQAKLTVADISGVGVAIAGYVNAPLGQVYWSPNLAERDVAFQEMLHRKFCCPVFLENDANVLALAEQRIGLGKNVQNFVVISVEAGVGMGIVVDGKLYRGANGSGAELAHTKVHLDGALCRCGQRGCLEAYVGDFALLREARTTLDRVAAAQPEHQMQALLDEARAGDELARSIFKRSGRMFAMGLANVVSLFSPELIVLCGERMYYDFLYEDGVVDEMKKSIFQAGLSLPEVQVHKWDGNMWAIGAATRAVDGVAEVALKRGAAET